MVDLDEPTTMGSHGGNNAERAQVRGIGGPAVSGGGIGQ
jgi:hypothetical protein